MDFLPDEKFQTIFWWEKYFILSCITYAVRAANKLCRWGFFLSDSEVKLEVKDLSRCWFLFSNLWRAINFFVFGALLHCRSWTLNNNISLVNHELLAHIKYVNGPTHVRPWTLTFIYIVVALYLHLNDSCLAMQLVVSCLLMIRCISRQTEWQYTFCIHLLAVYWNVIGCVWV